MLLQKIFDDCSLYVVSYMPVHGGDINEAYCLVERDEKCFLKINDANKYPGMFAKEMDGLDSLSTGCDLTIPGAKKCGIVEEHQYLLLEWMETGSPQKDFWEQFGASLALMHKKQQPFFGWKENNYIGSLPQRNNKHNLWNSFYAECRIMPLIIQLFNDNLFSKS